MRDEGDSYIISLPASRHEKDHYTLSADKRRIRLSMARRFENRVKNDEGEVHQTHRSETFSKEFEVPHIVKDGPILQKWEDNRLSYQIFKA